MKGATASVVMILCCLFTRAEGRTSVYIVTEQNEWQLYMGQNFWNEAGSFLNDTDAMVVIYLTAGDKSCDSATLDSNFYLARQRGANKSLEFAAEMPWIDAWSNPVVTINNHEIQTYTYRNIVTYCLQLPGGCAEGWHRQSIVKLYNGTIPSIQSVDGRNSYTKADLETTIGTMIYIAAVRAQDVSYNICEPDSSASTAEMREHSVTGRLALEVLSGLTKYRINLYKENGLLNLPPNLQPMEVANNAAMLSQMDRELTSSGYPSEWTSEHLELLSRCYIRTMTR